MKLEEALAAMRQGRINKMDDYVYLFHGNSDAFRTRKWKIATFGYDFEIQNNEEHRKKYKDLYLGSGNGVIFIKLPAFEDVLANDWEAIEDESHE